jgi:hypothetical protein
MPGKRVQIDEQTWRQLDLLSHDQMKDFQELADEAFHDLLKKHGRPVDLKDALRRSAGVSATVHQLQPGTGKKPGRK